MIQEFEIRIGNGLGTGRVETYRWNGNTFDLIGIQESLIYKLFRKIEKLLNIFNP